MVGVLGKEGAKDQEGVGQGEKDVAMAGDIATRVQFATGLGAMGRDGVCELFFEDCISLIDLAGVVGVALVGRGEVEKVMELLADDLGLLADRVPVEVTTEEGGHEGGSHDANREVHHEVIDEVGVVVVGHGMTVGVNHLSNGVGGLGGSFRKKFFEGSVQDGRDDDGGTGLIGAWRG